MEVLVVEIGVGPRTLTVAIMTSMYFVFLTNLWASADGIRGAIGYLRLHFFGAHAFNGRWEVSRTRFGGVDLNGPARLES